jgi:hypothetical protein
LTFLIFQIFAKNVHVLHINVCEQIEANLKRPIGVIEKKADFFPILIKSNPLCTGIKIEKK